MSDTLMLYEVDDVLEIDKLWSFVGSKEQRRWIWIALCRWTRQIVAFHIGKRDELAAQQLWQRVEYPDTLCLNRSISSLYGVLPKHLHWMKEKKSGATIPYARFVRKSLSFSKSDKMHQSCLSCLLLTIIWRLYYHLQISHYLNIE